MQRLRKLWRDVAARTGLPGHRLIEYILMAAYSGVGILAVILGLTAKAGGLLGRTVEHTGYAARPELRSVLKELLTAGADFSAGASLLVIAGLILYWSQRVKAARREAMEPPLPSGPPFLL
jgi:hypothetical protein